jgi:NAD(P)-dependent dehydrogenase (short-subunit alcohol dehydrogenase family)
MQNVEGKVAVVTGAASGIGRGIAERLAEAGMKVVLGDVEEGALVRTAEAMAEVGADVHPVRVDVSRVEQVEALAAATLSKYGAVHVLCNNAGIVTGSSPTWQSSLEDWNWILGVNLMGVIHGVRTFLPIMIEQDQEAHIVNTASTAGLMYGDGALYTGTKFAVVGMSESWYLELTRGGYKPRMSVLCPGFVDTNLLDARRNRPADLPAAPARPRGPEAEAAWKRINELFKRGLSPRTVGDRVLEAILDERFYILTHPHWTPNIEHRMRTILTGQNPKLVAAPPASPSDQDQAREPPRG